MDDNQLYLSFKPEYDGVNEKEAIDIMNRCICTVRKLMLQHKLIINDTKTEFMIVGSSKQLSKLKDCNVIVGSSTIQPVDKLRNLGVIFDNQLTMIDHINHVCKIGFYQLFRLKQIRNYFDIKTIESLVHSFITSHIDYCNSLFAGLPEVTIKKLQRLQNAAARLIVQKSRRDSITAILKDLHWLPVRFRVKFKICLTVYKCLNGSGPHYLHELLQYTHKRSLRSATNKLLVVPKMKTETFGKRSFKYCAPKYWNELPLNLRESDNICVFKKRLKTFYFNSAFT